MLFHYIIVAKRTIDISESYNNVKRMFLPNAKDIFK